MPEQQRLRGRKGLRFRPFSSKEKQSSMVIQTMKITTDSDFERECEKRSEGVDVYAKGGGGVKPYMSSVLAPLSPSA